MFSGIKGSENMFNTFYRKETCKVNNVMCSFTHVLLVLLD